MALIYSAIASLDGFVDDRGGRFEWAALDAQVHRAANELERRIAVHLLGRRMWETLRVWDTWDTTAGPDEAIDFAEPWRRTERIVFSRTLDAGEATGPRVRIAREFDPDLVRALVGEARRDVAVGGPTLAAEALRAELVNELVLFTVPVVVGGGTAWLPPDLALALELVESRRFTNGTTLARYAVR